MSNEQFLLYGANGYTGKLISRLAREYGLSPILAGRREEPVRMLASELNLDYRIIDLKDPNKLIKMFSDVRAILNVAGPFQYTARPVIEACLATQTHYADVTGEIAVFEMAKTYHQKAVTAGIMLLPGAGFDVVPTDCLALFLKNHLPDANDLKLAFTTLHGSVSHGTATTMVENLGNQGVARINGKIISVPIGQNSMVIDFDGHKQFVMSIPWGDISTAYHTTGIENITTFTGVSKRIHGLLKFQRLFNWILRMKIVREILKSRINLREAGPSEEARQKATCLVWGEVKNAGKSVVQATIKGPEGYTLTAHSSLIIMKKILEGDYKSGYHTPAGIFGADLILAVPGIERRLVKSPI